VCSLRKKGKELMLLFHDNLFFKYHRITESPFEKEDIRPFSAAAASIFKALLY